MKIGLVIALLGLAATGCSTPVIWYGHDLDRNRRFELRREDGRNHLHEAPRDHLRRTLWKSGGFDVVALADLAFSPAGDRFAFAARRADRWHVVVDRKEGPAFAGVATLAFGPDGRQFVYAAQSSAGTWSVVQNGHLGQAFVGLVEGSFSFSPDGRRFAYAGIERDCVRVVINGQPGPCHAAVHTIRLANDPGRDLIVTLAEGQHVVASGTTTTPVPGLVDFIADAQVTMWAAVTRAPDQTSESVLVNGQVRDAAQKVRDLQLLPDGRLSYVARLADGWHVVLAGERRGPYADVSRPVFDETAAHHGYIAQGTDGRSIVIVDGVEKASWPWAAALVLGPQGKFLYAVQRAEGPAIATNDRLYPVDTLVENTLVHSRDGRHWAALVGSLRAKQLSILVSGSRLIPFDSVEFFGAQAEGASKPEQLRRWVSAELERQIRQARW